MPRITHVLAAAVLTVGLGFGIGAPLAQTPADPPAQTTPAPKAKKGLTAEERAQLKEERAAKRKAMTREEKAQLKQERAAKKEAKAAAKAKRQQCVAQGKQDNLKGAKLREFLKTCTAS